MKHLLAVWNPTYEADALQLHLEVLLQRMAEFRAGRLDADDVYVWWGKLRSNNRQQALPHLADVLALNPPAEPAADEPELHLYLTDYRSLYVAQVGEVTQRDVLADDPTAVPRYYAESGRNADCWFLLWDLRRLVHDDTPSVVRELGRLRNTRYHDRPVSIYGGMVDLPLIVTREDASRWFDPETRERMIGERFWAEYDAERTGAAAMQRELRENRFGNAAWEALDPAARAFIASAEEVFRRHRDDPSFRLNGVVLDFANAVEVQVNLLFRQAMYMSPEAMRFANVEHRRLDLSKDGPLSLGALARLIGEDEARNGHLRKRLGEWFAASLPALLRELTELRNAAAHGGTVSRDAVARLRNALMGVGSVGQLLQLAQVRAR
ncbi:MAG TPA: hypothetical protein PLY94_03360 [Gemmatimonadaceae bacterium]|nr:hypothetical protein [Gemmatimonadaceae bacterium]